MTRLSHHPLYLEECSRDAALLRSAAAGLAGVDRLALARPDGGAWLVDDGLTGHPAGAALFVTCIVSTQHILTEQHTL